jgi:hypothetical protein
MGLTSPGGLEQGRRAASGQFTQITAAPSGGVPVSGDFNVSVWGAFTGTIALTRSFDGGTTWLPLTFSNGAAIAWSAPFSTIMSEPETGVLVQLACTALSAGTPNWRISQ